jgi:hypothetical protein
VDDAFGIGPDHLRRLAAAAQACFLSGVGWAWRTSPRGRNSGGAGWPGCKLAQITPGFSRWC